MSGFNLNTEELTKLNTWLSEHDKTCRLAKYSGAIGGRLTYEFTPTSLSTIVHVQCACCREARVDLTDYDAF